MLMNFAYDVKLGGLEDTRPGSWMNSLPRTKPNQNNHKRDCSFALRNSLNHDSLNIDMHN